MKRGAISAAAWFYSLPGVHSMPSAETVRKTDAAMARTDAGLCGFCGAPANQDGEPCAACKEAE